MTDVEKLEFENKLLADEVKRLREELEKEKAYKKEVYDALAKDPLLFGIISMSIHDICAKAKECCKCE